MSNVSARTPLTWSYLLAALGAVLFALFLIASPGTSAAGKVVAAGGAGVGAIASATATYVPGALAWTEVVTPDLHGLSSSLSDIDAQSANDVWAVGSFDHSDTATKGLFIHWDGKAWNKLPDPGTTGFVLTALSVAGPDDVWVIAAKEYFQVDPSELEFRTMHWDGQDWDTLPAPAITGTVTIEDIEAIASDDVWLVGSKSVENETGTDTFNLMLHWNGSAWTEYTIPGSGLGGISALSTDDIWAVGHAFIHWDGSSWTVVQEYTNATHTGFNSVVAINENDAWAVGSTGFFCGIGCNGTSSEMAHWDGTTWDLGPFTSVHAGLSEVDATGPDDVWVVGTRNYNNDIQGFHESGSVILHWNGTRWEDMSHPVQEYLAGVAAVSPTDIWAVGTGIAQDKYGMAVLHYGENPAFRDVPLGSTFYPYISCLSDLGFISGFPDGTFRPGDSVTRGQLAKIVANTAGLDAEVPESRQTFADVPPPPAEGSTYWLYVERLYERGVIAGYDCTPGPDGPLPCDPLNRKYYLPNAPVSRGQTSKIV
ncbi:MAG TPA: S-layer homology domain-containing protein, partial [Chloroflexia bacterium]